MNSPKNITGAMVFVTALLLSGCVATSTLPEGYAGPTAVISDSGFAEDGTKAQIFGVIEVDGTPVRSSLDATRSASFGKGLWITTRFLSRPVPVKPLKLKLSASHQTAAPIHAILSQAAGTFLSVEVTVDFTPAAEGLYVVKGELKDEGSTLWIEDAVTGKPVTQRYTGR